ncbi:MBL fold metallo-hydrolase [Colwellia sp. RSH04]|uniref:MBL fold metallo-hydrolase n=1 Tax=Colwellia sp. RSH04 TaxID=2305464 RepID=UPI000E5848FF|nr:MBL fold metallo-hydrolase [Colwellia sp. RSH04]RHW75393.1 MBL fold metallo-hydrolase [Colwellia sp. RSH04]
MFTFKTLGLVSILALSSTHLLAQENSKLSFSTTEVAPGLHMLIGVGGFTGGNLGLSVGDDGVILIDDSMPPMLDIMNTAIKSITDKPVDFLINTHVHGDHTGNNEALANSGAHIVAHKNLREHLLTKGVKGKDGMEPAPKAALPVITFSNEMNFHLNNEDAHIFHVAHAHTDGDAVIHFTSSNVIHTGDTLFNGMFPYIDINSGGSINGYIAAQQKILSLSNDKTKIIPGHGPLATKADVQASISMLKDAKNIIEKLISKGQTEEDIVALNPLKKYHDKWNWGFITTERMTRQMVKGLSMTKTNQQTTSHTHNEETHRH